MHRAATVGLVALLALTGCTSTPTPTPTPSSTEATTPAPLPEEPVARVREVLTRLSTIATVPRFQEISIELGSSSQYSDPAEGLYINNGFALGARLGHDGNAQLGSEQDALPASASADTSAIDVPTSVQWATTWLKATCPGQTASRIVFVALPGGEVATQAQCSQGPRVIRVGGEDFAVPVIMGDTKDVDRARQLFLRLGASGTRYLRVSNHDYEHAELGSIRAVLETSNPQTTLAGKPCLLDVTWGIPEKNTGLYGLRTDSLLAFQCASPTQWKAAKPVPLTAINAGVVAKLSQGKDAKNWWRLNLRSDESGPYWRFEAESKADKYTLEGNPR